MAKIERLKELLGKATPGPWGVRSHGGYDYGSTTYWAGHVMIGASSNSGKSDAELISLMRELIEPLLEYVSLVDECNVSLTPERAEQFEKLEKELGL